MGCPPAPYIKEQGEEAAGQGEACQGGVLLPLGVGLLLARLLPGRPHAPCSFIYEGRGYPIDTTIDCLIF